MAQAPSTDATSNEPAKAELRLYKKKSDTKEFDTISCIFRPNELSISKNAHWEGPTTTGARAGAQDDTLPMLNVPHKRFRGGEPAHMTLNLFFDTTDTGQDVRNYTDKLFTLTIIQKDTQKTSPKPPYCRFVWGKIVSFMAYVTDVNVRLTFFKPNGTPVRAEASVTLEQAMDEAVFPKQNPTSFSEANRVWVVVEGETLDWIAYEEYGDPSAWRHIAQTNNLLNPKDLRPGQILKLTPLS